MSKPTDENSLPPREYSSPACYAHEFEPAAGAGAGTPAGAEPNGWEEVRPWRKRMREQLIARRMEQSTTVWRAKGQRARDRLLESVDLRQHATLGIYWPIKGEIDPRPLARRHLEAGGQVALPVVVSRGEPVEFWKWQPGTRMRLGLWDIPIPAERVVLEPDALIIPLVGFDAAGYRLGYGGGYYDRTLAASRRRPFRVGLGYAESFLPTIYPQPHDIPMSLIVTDRHVTRLGPD